LKIDLIAQSIRNNVFVLSALTLAIISPAASAASVSLAEPATISGDTNISTNGSLAYACADSGTATTVNNVTFAAGFAPAVSINDQFRCDRNTKSVFPHSGSMKFITLT
jgi:hypothetical protein